MIENNQKASVYSLPDCSKCDELKKWLKKRNIDYEAKWFDTKAQTEFIMRNIFGNPPILEVGERAESSEYLFSGEELIESKVLEVLNIGKG